MVRLVTAGLLLFPLCLPAQSLSNPLPIQRVVLYKNGVGYFEHVGHVRDNQDVAIPFTSGQLNDVLKSLTVLDLNGGRITGVSYGSSAPAGRQIGDLHLAIGEKTSLTEILGALRGARLELQTGGATIKGRLLSVDRKTRISGGTTLEIDYVTLLAENGEVKTTELAPGFGVKLLDPGLSARIGQYLDILSADREPDVRRMVISSSGTGDRSLFVSYISEVPVWKATYRIVLRPKETPLLQGWAIVDNVVGQDWDHVQLSLVAGAPQSFVQSLSQPYFTRRPVVPLPESVSIAPQTYEATLIPGGARLMGRVTDPAGGAIPGAQVKAMDANGNVIAETTAGADGSYSFASIPEGKLKLRVQSAGFNDMVIDGVPVGAGRANQQDARLQLGTVSQTVTVQADAATVNTSTDSSVTRYSRTGGTGLALGSGAALGGVRAGSGRGGGIGSGSGGGFGAGMYTPPAADARELGDLFEYKLKDPISIQKNRSAMVPIVQSAIGAEKVSIWNDRSGSPRPQRALWLTNSSGLTLDGGSFSVMEEETFAGEGVFDPIRPGEKRLVSYATDLGVTAGSKNAVDQQRVMHVIVANGTMKQESEVRERRTYTFRNEDAAPRTIIVEHPVRMGYELRSDVLPFETTAAWMRFRMPLLSKQTATLVVEEARPVVSTVQILNINPQQVELFVKQRSIPPQVEAALRTILAQKQVIADLDNQKEARDDETKAIYDDQQRLRENIKALKGSPEEKALLQRYTQQLNEQENRLESLRRSIAKLETDAGQAQGTLDRMIAALSFDVKL